MFTMNHFVWLGISVAIIITTLFIIKKNHYSLLNVLHSCCVICVLSELIKIMSVIKLVPSDGGMFYPYLELEYLPFHLCSIQILFIFYVTFKKRGKLRDILLAFMYPTCIMGGILALCLPPLFTSTIGVQQAFTHPLAYQFFLYHSMLIVLGITIYRCKEVTLRPYHYFYTIGIFLLLILVSIYLNSLFATPVYENGELVSVQYVTNFFYTYKPPFDIQFSSIEQWYRYIATLVLLGCVTIGLFYIPVFWRKNES